MLEKVLRAVVEGGGYRYQNEQTGIVEDDITATLRSESATTDERSVPAYILQSPSTGNVPHCLNAGGMGRIDYESETLVAQTLRGEGFDAPEDGTGRQNLVPVVAPCLTGNYGKQPDNSDTNAGPMLVACIQERAICENPEAGPDGVGVRTDGVSYTLEARTVPQAVAFQSRASHHNSMNPSEVCPTLDVGKSEGMCVAFAQNQLGEVRTGDVANTINTNSNASGRNTPMVAFAQNTRDEVRLLGGDGQIAGVLAAETGMKQQTYMATTMAVRRLTPRECERLQGFKDDYTLIPYGKQPDGPRYKALGNSFAVPVINYIGRKIEEALRV